MTPLEQLENKIRQSIPELKEEYEIFQDGAIDRDMITQIALNHVLEYLQDYDGYVWQITIYGYLHEIDSCEASGYPWNLKSAYLKDQLPELITFLNGFK
jgi:hypothetical protein